MESGCVVWITGLSGAGKSTLAAEFTARLRSAGRSVVMLDGDELRAVMGVAAESASNHGREGRLELAMRYASLCRLLANQGVVVVIATISMFKEVHVWNRRNLPNYLEAYLKVPESELRRRDPKGIYRRFDAGELKNVAGLDFSVDEPESPDWIAEFAPEVSAEQLADNLMDHLMRRQNEN